MKHLLILLVILTTHEIITAQNIGINATGALPHTSAMLDVSASNKGILVPRMTSAQRIAIPSPAVGLLVFDNQSNGFWFYNGAAWTEIAADNSGWALTGNTSINVASNFIGTTDNNPLHFRVNNIHAGVLDSATQNTAYGYKALDSSFSTLLSNSSFGYKTLGNNINGVSNTALGSNALRSSKTGSLNTATGSSSLYYNYSGNNNTATGVFALYYNYNGKENTASGSSALYSNQTGNNNTADGIYALSSNTSGSNNTAGGASALYNSTTGDNNTALGNTALFNNITGDHNIAIGSGAGTATYGSGIFNTISIGNDDILNGYQNQAFIGNTSTAWIGGNTTWHTFSDGRIKNNLMEDVKRLDFILKLRPVTYHVSSRAIVSLSGNKATCDFPGKYENEKIKYSGFVAQEVEQAAKASGYEFSGYTIPKDQYGLYSLSYEQFVVPLVKAAQEQQRMITALQQTIRLLQQKIQALETQNKKLPDMIQRN